MYSRLIWEAETEEEIKVEDLKKTKKELEKRLASASRMLKLVGVALAASGGTFIYSIFRGMKNRSEGEKQAFKDEKLFQKIGETIKLLSKSPLSDISFGLTLASLVVFVVYLIKDLKVKSELKTPEVAKLTESYIHESWILTETETNEDNEKFYEKIKKFITTKPEFVAKLGKGAKAFFNSKTGKILGGASLLALVVFAVLIVKKNVAPNKSMGEFIVDLLKTIKSHPWSLGVAFAVAGIAGIIYAVTKPKEPEEPERLKGYSKSDLKDTLTDSINNELR
jgi:predicted small secreted protein